MSRALAVKSSSGSPAASETRSLSSRDRSIQDSRGRGVRIAVLDSGVNADNPHVSGVFVGHGIGPTGRSREDFVDRIGHGTAVAAAIQEKSPEAEILVIKIFEDELATTLPSLVGGLELSLESDVRLVNLSLGSPRPEHEAVLGEVVGRSRDRGVLIVSPIEHRGRRWWPGALPGVAGVLLDWTCPRQEIRLMAGPGGELVFRASGYPRPVPDVPPDRNLRGISFAAANVTGILARVLELQPEIRTVEEAASWMWAASSSVPPADGPRG